MSVLLTDDEVVALAVDLAAPWRGSLPTVEVTTEGLRQAAFRGMRSLGVRGLGRGEANAMDADLARRAISTAPMAQAFVAAEASPLTPASSAVGIYPTEADEVIVNVIMASGVHEFSVSSRPRARAVLQGLVARYQQEGTAQDGRYVLTLLDSGDAEPGSTVTVVRQYQVNRHRCLLDSQDAIVLGVDEGSVDVKSIIDGAVPDIPSANG